MQLKEHENEALASFGKPWTNLHQFLDQYYGQFRGYNHRRILHHARGVDLCVEKFGEDAREPAEQHVKSDMNGLLPNSWEDYERYFLPLGDEEERQDYLLEQLYGNLKTNGL